MLYSSKFKEFDQLREIPHQIPRIEVEDLYSGAIISMLVELIQEGDHICLDIKAVCPGIESFQGEKAIALFHAGPELFDDLVFRAAGWVLKTYLSEQYEQSERHPVENSR